MLELDTDNVVPYLRDRGWLKSGIPTVVTQLAWGVSNVVLRLEPAGQEPFVLKQSRTRLRTPAPWFSRRDRIWREADVMRGVAALLPEGVVPRVLFEDRANFLFLMEAVPANHDVWKQRLLEGRAEPEIAGFLGGCLASLHRETAYRPEWRTRFGDTEVFVQLRVDPFYRRVAEVWPEIRPHVDRLIESMAAAQVCLVHADFSPKNVLITGGRIALVDFETGHYGDPAFDLGFFLSHLLLKTVLHRRKFPEYAGLTTAFWKEYVAGVASLARRAEFDPRTLVSRAVPHLAGCLWARIDGTSQIDYLPDPHDQQIVRAFCRNLFVDPPGDWSSMLERLVAALNSGAAYPPC